MTTEQLLEENRDLKRRIQSLAENIVAVEQREHEAEARLAAVPKLWECPDCAFTFDADHENELGGYSCPACAELRLEKALESARARLAAVLAATEARRAARDLSFTAYTDLRRAAEGTHDHQPPRNHH